MCHWLSFANPLLFADAIDGNTRNYSTLSSRFSLFVRTEVSFLHHDRTGLLIQITWWIVRAGEYAKNGSPVNNLWFCLGGGNDESGASLELMMVERTYFM